MSEFETMQEYASSNGVLLAVDREAGVISGVKILGLESDNNRTYLPEALQNALALYEGAKVNVNHPKGSPTGPRDYRDRIGVVRKIARRNDGLYADFHFNPKHALAEQLIWDAEHAPANVGFSHNVEAKTSRKNGRVIVEEIKSVQAVDLVADPATTRGLFESETIPDDPQQRALCEHGLSAISDARSILFGDADVAEKQKRISAILCEWRAELAEGVVGDAIAKDEYARAIRKLNETVDSLVCQALYNDEEYPELDCKKARILAVVEDWEKQVQKLSPRDTAKESEMEWKEITAESLREHRGDLVEALAEEDSRGKAAAVELTETKAALEAAETKLATIEAENAKNAKAATIAEELKAAKLDATNAVAVSETFVESLVAASDAAARQKLIEDRVALMREQPRRVAGSAPMAAVGDDAEIGPGATAKETLARLR